jgi:hypothetical protein
LLESFVEAFEKLDDLRCTTRQLDPAAWALRIGKSGRDGRRWRPRKLRTAARVLEPLYAGLPGRFPALYEHLVLSYRWAEVDLGRFRLLANPRSRGLEGLRAEVLRDRGLTERLLPLGYIPFGKGPNLNYDPVCFDTRRRGNRDCPVVQIDHEGILSFYRVEVVAELAPSFRALAEGVVAAAGSTAR